MRALRLVRDFNFIIPYEVSQSGLLACTRTDTFVNKLNSVTFLLLWLRRGRVCAGFLLGS